MRWLLGAPLLLLCLGWLVLSVRLALNFLKLHRLSDTAAGVERHAPRVSIVVAARNEEAAIGEALQSLCDLDYPDLEIIAIDDRSEDRTGEIIARLAAENRRLAPLTVEVLPTGWLGKTHALQKGVERATGEWILFTDADVKMAPDSLRRAVKLAGATGVDHLAIFPDLVTGSFFLKVAAGTFGACLLGMLNLERLKDPRSGHCVGVGAFNLVRADALNDIGGHEALRMEVVDDHQLARLLYRAGKRTRGYFAGGDVEMDFARTAAGVVRAIEKNAFAMVRYNTLLAVAIAVILSALLAGTFMGPIVGGFPGLLAGLGFLSMTLPASMLARRYEWPVVAGLLAPLGLFVVLAAAANSVVRILRHGGVRWRSDFYRLDELRAGMIR